MAKYTGPVYKKSRRVGFSILETGRELLKKPYVPGQHGQNRRSKQSEYGIQLNEKQKVRFMYGLNERQFRTLFDKASKMKGVHGENFLKLLESRLDNIVYRLGFGRTRKAARQIVNHGHINVNGKKVDIASYQLKPSDIIAVRESAKDHPMIKASLEIVNKRLDFLSYDDSKMEGTYVRYPERTELNPEINESLIVEYYSK